MPYLISKSHVRCDLFFTTNLNRQASEQSANVCVAWQVTSAFCVCSLIDNGREPIRNEDSGFFVVKQFFLILFSQEEQRQKAKKAREDLRIFLENHRKMHSTVRWRRACELFDGDPVWEAVHERDRKDVFDDVVFFLTKKEKEEEKELKTRNRKLMTQIYNSMASVTYRTTWSEVRPGSFL